jgi:hypothetical protein
MNNKTHVSGDYITQTFAAQKINMSVQNFTHYIKKNNPKFIVTVDGKKFVDPNNKEYKKLYNERKNQPPAKKQSEYKLHTESAAIKKIAKLKQQLEKANGNNVGMGQELDATQKLAIELSMRVEIAAREIKISQAKIAKERSEQEELKTLEMKRETAPIELVKFFFSFAENMIQRIYRRPHEIEADLETLFMGGQKKKATQKLIREMEAIVEQSKAELIERMKQEHFDIKKIIKAVEKFS